MIKIEMDSTHDESDDGYLTCGTIKTNGNGKVIFHELIAVLLALYDQLPDGMLIDALGALTKELADRQKKGD